MRFKYLLLIFIVLLVSGLRIRFYSRFSRNYLPGQRVRITERLTEQPYQSRSGQFLRLAGFRMLAPDFPAYSLGSVLRVEGVVKRSDSTSDAGLLAFSVPDFWLIYPNITVIEEDAVSHSIYASSGQRWLGWVYRLRSTMVDYYGKVLPEPHASLLAGIVLGERATMPLAFYTRLRETGSLHIIAASGMNVTIIAGILVNSLVLVISRKRAIIVAILGVAFYAFLSGLSPSIVRAALMGLIAYLAMAFGKERDGLIALIVVVAAMLLVKPDYLVDIGWQLSVAATLGIVLLREPIKRYISICFDSLSKFLVGRRWEVGGGKASRLALRTSIISEELAVTLSAQVLTLPLVVWHFGVLSWTSPLVNVLLAPVVPVLMIWGAILAILGMIWPFMAKVVAWGAWVFLEYFVRVVEGFGRWFGAVEVGEVPILMVLGYYLVIFWLIWRIKGKVKEA